MPSPARGCLGRSARHAAARLRGKYDPRPRNINVAAGGVAAIALRNSDGNLIPAQAPNAPPSPARAYSSWRPSATSRGASSVTRARTPRAYGRAWRRRSRCASGNRRSRSGGTRGRAVGSGPGCALSCERTTPGISAPQKLSKAVFVSPRPDSAKYSRGAPRRRRDSAEYSRGAPRRVPRPVGGISAWRTAVAERGRQVRGPGPRAVPRRGRRRRADGPRRGAGGREPGRPGVRLVRGGARRRLPAPGRRAAGPALRRARARGGGRTAGAAGAAAGGGGVFGEAHVARGGGASGAGAFEAAS